MSDTVSKMWRSMMSMLRGRELPSEDRESSEVRFRPPGMVTSTPAYQDDQDTQPLLSGPRYNPTEIDDDYYDSLNEFAYMPNLAGPRSDTEMQRRRNTYDAPVPSAPRMEDIGPDDSEADSSVALAPRIRLPRPPKPQPPVESTSLSDRVRMSTAVRKPQLEAPPFAPTPSTYQVPRPSIIKYSSDTEIPPRSEATTSRAARSDVQLPWRMLRRLQPEARRPAQFSSSAQHNPVYEFEEDDYYMPPSQSRRITPREVFSQPDTLQPRPQNSRRQRRAGREMPRQPSVSPRRGVLDRQDSQSESSSSEESDGPSASEILERTQRRAGRQVTVTAPKFHGKDWPTYILRFEACATLHGWTDAEKVRILPTCLEGDTVLAMQSKRSKTWSYKRLVQELYVRYCGKIDSDEVERQIRESRQTPEQSYSAFYDQLYSLALKLKKSDRATEQMTLRAFKAGLYQLGLRGYLVKEKPKDIAEAFQHISQWEAMARAAQPFNEPRVSEVLPVECNVVTEDIGKLGEGGVIAIIKRVSAQLIEATNTIARQIQEVEEYKKEVGELRAQIQQQTSQTYGQGGNRSNWRGNGRGYRGRGYYRNNRGGYGYNNYSNNGSYANSNGGGIKITIRIMVQITCPASIINKRQIIMHLVRHKVCSLY